MTQLSTRIFPNTLLTFDTATLTGSYQFIGSLPESTRIIKFKNSSSVPVTISWNGVNDHDVLAAGEFTLLDISSNREVASNVLEIPKGQGFFIKGSAGIGLVYISSYYAY